MLEEDSESEYTGSKENNIPEEEEGMDVGDFSSNLDGYLESKEKSGKEHMEENSEDNSNQGKSGEEGNKIDSSVNKDEMKKAIEDPIMEEHVAVFLKLLNNKVFNTKMITLT